MQSYTKVAYKSRGCELGEWMGCGLCGGTATDVHHIDGRLGDLLNDPKNLIRLCRMCHDKVHSSNTQEVKAELKKIVLFSLI